MVASIQLDHYGNSLLLTLWCIATDLSATTVFPRCQLNELITDLQCAINPESVDWQSLANSTGWQVEVLERSEKTGSEQHMIAFSSCLSDGQSTVEWVLRVPYTELRIKLLEGLKLNHN